MCAVSKPKQTGAGTKPSLIRKEHNRTYFQDNVRWWSWYRDRKTAKWEEQSWKQQRSRRAEIFKTGVPPDANAASRSFYLWLIVVLDAHGEDVDADDEGDEEVQVVARAQRVDGQTQRGVVGVVGSLLGLWGAQTRKMRTLKQTDWGEAAVGSGLLRQCKGPRTGNSANIYLYYYIYSNPINVSLICQHTATTIQCNLRPCPHGEKNEIKIISFQCVRPRETTENAAVHLPGL